MSKPYPSRNGEPGPMRIPLTGGGHLPPHNLDAERGVLGAILQDNSRLADVLPVLDAEDFYRDSHRIIYKALLNLFADGKPADTTMLAECLALQGQFEAAGGLDGIAEIVRSISHSANAEFHARIVHDYALRRAVIEAANQSLEDAYSKNFTGEQLVERSQQHLFPVLERNVSESIVSMVDLVDRVLTQIDERKAGKLAGISTGLVDLDRLFGGFPRSGLTLIAARPSMGKTALAVQCAMHAAQTLRIPTLIISLEMPSGELVERLLGSIGRVPIHFFTQPEFLNDPRCNQILQASNQLREIPILICDPGTYGVLEIGAKARLLRLQKRAGLLVIDYIQLINHRGDEDGVSRQEQVSQISRHLKALAMELEIPVIALSQLNRQAENRVGHRPRLSDLRESGALEQDADLVLLLHRPEYYDPNDQPGECEVIIAKNRNGPTGTVKVAFQAEYTRFENLKTSVGPIDAGGF